MNTTISVSKHSKLLLLKPQSASYLLRRHICTDSQPPPPLDDEESKINRAVELLLVNPHQQWSSNEPLQSLVFSSPSPSPRFFYKIIRGLASSTLALNFFKHIQQNSQSQDTQFLSYPFQALLEQADREPDAGSRIPEFYQASKEWGIPLTINTAGFLIRWFGRNEMVNESVVLYNGIDPSLKNTHVRNGFLKVLLRDGRVEYALNVLDEMLQPYSKFQPDNITCDIVFGCGLRNSSEVDTVKFVLKLGKHGAFPKSKNITQIIYRLCKSGKIDQAWNFLHELLTLRAPLKTSPFDALLTALGKCGKIKRMHTLIAEMKENGILPNAVTFGILINQLCKSRRVDEAMEVLKKLDSGNGSDGFSVQADVIIYNTVIDGLCRVGRQDEGLHLMERMRSMKNCAPNIVTYNCLIDGFCKAGHIEKGKDLFNQMKEEGISPNVITVNMLVDAMCRQGMITSAFEFFSDMQGKGLKANAVTYTTLINAYCNADNIVKAVDMFDRMLTDRCSPNAVVYCSLISGFCKAGRMDGADIIFSKMKEAGFRPDILCYNSLVSAFCKENMVDKAYDIIKEMQEAGMKPDCVSYNTLIANFCKTGNILLAQEAMKQMIDGGIVPTISAYSTLIHAHCLNGSIEEAMKLFKDMSSISKIPTNTIIYNILIESLCKNNDIKGALFLMDDMKAKVVKPNTTTYNAIFKGLKENNLLEDAFRLMDDMIEHACNPDYITMEILREWLSAVGQSERLINFVQGYKDFVSWFDELVPKIAFLALPCAFYIIENNRDFFIIHLRLNTQYSI